MEGSFKNGLLDALTPDEFQRLGPRLELVALRQGEVLCEEGRPVTHVYFPTTSLVSVLCSTSSGESIQVAAVASDGVVGLTFAASGHWTPGRAVVESAGLAWRLPVAALRFELMTGGNLQLLALRHQQLLMVQMAQTALCSRLHRVDQQLCRWILVSLDREGGDRLPANQQQVARLLGVRREAISAGSGRLQQLGLLHWGRGRLHVTDRRRLEAHCCECYSHLRAQAQDFFPSGGSVRDRVLCHESIERHA
jgi:CRP-like cAMP-binding protein